MNNSSVALACRNISGIIRCRKPGPGSFPPEIQDLLKLDANLKPIFTGLTFSCIAIALLGNMLIILTILRDKRIRGMAHIFLLNIAVSDILYSVVNLAGAILSHAMTPQALKANNCLIHKPLVTARFVCYAASVFSIATLSVERWYAICQPFAAARKTVQKKKLKILIFAVIWILSFAVAFPLALCETGHEKVHAIVLASTLLVLPSLIILFANGMIILSIKNADIFEVSEHGNEGRRKRDSLLKLLVAIIISFIVFWLPYNVLYLYLQFASRPPLVTVIKLGIISRAVTVTSYFHPALNAFLYYGFCKDFRRGLRDLIRKSGICL
ncbi:neuropeptide FF receptor 1 [Nematostella vectensis]|uniref:neuropeptide FF receptor 1 n=1 Tax=Nematostella vectensis TaxID=45351 RepID=UPI0020773EF9|nr:neuropeptide FF receptor 1 [Nematostella vectensis]